MFFWHAHPPTNHYRLGSAHKDFFRHIKFWIFARFSKRGGYFFGEINDTKLVYFLHRSAESFKISGSKTVCFSC